MIKCISSFFVTFLFLSNAVLAQQSITICGNVNKLQYVNIVLEGSEYGTTTDKTGDFTLKVFTDKKPFVLKFSKIGYNDTTIKITPQIDIDTININVSLSKKSYLLKEINITSNFDFYSIKDAEIKDINFIGSYIIVLTTEKKKTELVILNKFGEVLKKQKINANYEMINKDCFGNYELVGKDSCMQFIFNEKDTLFYAIDKFPTTVYYEKLEPCLLKFHCIYLFTDVHINKYNTYVNKYHNKKVNFYSFNICDSLKKKKLLATFFDSSSFKIASSYYCDILSIYQHIVPINQNIISGGSWDGDMKKLIVQTNNVKFLKDEQKLFNLISWYLKVEAAPITVKVFKKNNVLLFFNLNNYTLIKYNNNLEPIDTVFLAFDHKQKIENIVQDEKTKITYALFFNNGIFYLGNINIITGKIENIIKANDIPFPKIFKLYNNTSYSVYYNLNSRLSKIIRKKLNK